jgi:hypothetical protein
MKMLEPMSRTMVMSGTGRLRVMLASGRLKAGKRKGSKLP